jgi:predicted AAA+ superfamily ATPase
MIEGLVKLSQEFLQTKNQRFRRYFIQNVTLEERFSILKGPRGIGKTTTMIQYLLDYTNHDRFHPSILYVQADHFVMGTMALYEVAEQFSLMGGEFIAFDEIHKYPEWSMELKSIYDTFPHLKILASGSSALEIEKGSHDLSRRAIIYRLTGLSFREYLELAFDVVLPRVTLAQVLSQHQPISEKIQSALLLKKCKILPAFKKYLEGGYYPYFYESGSEAKFKITLEQNVHTTLESDLASIYPHLSQTSIRKIKQLLIFLAQNVPMTPNWHHMIQLLEIGDERTIKNYFKLLEDAELIHSLYSSSTKLKAIDHPAKIYIKNTNLMHALATDGVNTGTVRETFFFDMLCNSHKITLPTNGDFLVDNKFLFEIGGHKKNFSQIRNSQVSYVAADGIEMGVGNKIPLWLFGFLY